MKKIFFISILFLTGLLSSCQQDMFSEEVTLPTQGQPVPINENHPLKDSIDAVVKKHLKKGIPGVQVILKDGNGWFMHSGGYAKIEDKTPMSTGAPTFFYSITKTFTAALAMIFVEKNKISLDGAITNYLPSQITDNIANSDKITVRMLLNHTSGLDNFTTTPGYFLTELNSPLNQYMALTDQLHFIYNKPTLFEPGTDFFYSNSNFALIQLILEKVSGQSWEYILRTEILEPQHLKHIYYPVTDQQITSMGFPNYYFERHNDGKLENCTKWHNSIAQSLQGYGGLAGHGSDAINFLEALVHGRVVSDSSLEEMRNWVQSKHSTEPDYGLGLEYYEQNYQPGVPTYGHEGDNIGGTTQVLYIPSNDAFLFISINAGRQLYGQYLFKTSELKIDLCKLISRS